MGRRAASFPLAGKGSEAVTPYPFAYGTRPRPNNCLCSAALAALDQKDCRPERS
jgi:hypothetical protein